MNESNIIISLIIDLYHIFDTHQTFHSQAVPSTGKLGSGTETIAGKERTRTRITARGMLMILLEWLATRSCSTIKPPEIKVDHDIGRHIPNI